MSVAEAIDEGRIGGRLWLYANYHCNLRCSYCLTESAPGVDRRLLAPEVMVRRAHEARDLGFTALGVTGGEPFLLDWMPELIDELAGILPVIVLSNARCSPAAGWPHWSGSPGRPCRSRSRSTVRSRSPTMRCAARRTSPLHRALGVGDEDHVVRPIVRRGRARSGDLGVAAGFEQLEPELTLSADGAFASPFGPTVHGGRLDTDLLVTRTTAPLSVPAGTLARLVGSRTAGRDARLGIR